MFQKEVLELVVAILSSECENSFLARYVSLGFPFDHNVDVGGRVHHMRQIRFILIVFLLVVVRDRETIQSGCLIGSVGPV